MNRSLLSVNSTVPLLRARTRICLSLVLLCAIPFVQADGVTSCSAESSFNADDGFVDASLLQLQGRRHSAQETLAVIRAAANGGPATTSASTVPVAFVSTAEDSTLRPGASGILNASQEELRLAEAKAHDAAASEPALNWHQGLCLRQRQVRLKAALLGDSITEWARVNILDPTQSGWEAMLANSFARSVDIVNRGFVGYNTRHYLATLPVTFQRQDQRLLFATIWFGANDAAQNEKQFVPLEEYGNNLRIIVQRTKQMLMRRFRLQTTIVVLGPPPVKEASYPDRSNARTKKYSDKAKTIAISEEVKFIDVYQGFLDTGLFPDGITFDGLHPNAVGQKWIYDAIMAELPASWQNPVWPRSIPQDFPFSDHLDPNDPAKSMLCSAVRELDYPVLARRR